MSTVLEAVVRYAGMENRSMSEIYASSNRINQKGDKLEFFAKDLFCGSFDLESKDEKQKVYENYLSYLGEKNHPPDFILRNGEAFEVKKTTSKAGSVQLNSSHPHKTLESSYEKLSEKCRNCEDWNVKDLVYIIGRVPKGSSDLDFMWMFYGDCWAAENSLYEKLDNKISEKLNEVIEEIEHGHLSEDTNELGKVKEADPLERTNLRIRGMWKLSHPANEFKKFIDNYEQKISDKQPLFTVMKKSKYREHPKEIRENVEESEDVKINRVEIPDPSNPSKNVKALILETGI